jgi:hypothetical protein
MLRESVDALPPTMADDDAAATSRARLLESFVDAVVGDDPDMADRSRRALVEAFGPEWLVDAAAVVANFEMMTRLADGTGARLRPAQIEATAVLRAELGIDAFASRR